MSKIIDLISIAGAVGVTGFFIYKVILPQLSTLKFPVFQPPNISFLPQMPWQQQQQQQQQQQPQTSTLPTQAPAAGGLLYDSNTHGKWNNGVKRTISGGGEGGQGPDGKGFRTAASGNPSFTIDGNGVGHLSTSELGRIYIYAKNYNARLEGNLMFETNNSPKDNISIKLRSRHNHSGHNLVGGSGCPCGGVGASYHQDGSVELQVEPCHETDKGHNVIVSGGKAPVPQVGKWYKFSYSVWDGADGSINSKFDIDGQTVATGKETKPAAACKDKAAYNADSYFWIRFNSYGGTAKAAFSNLRLYELGSTVTTQNRFMVQQQQLRRYPYLFNSYYNRRRL